MNTFNSLPLNDIFQTFHGYFGFAFVSGISHVVFVGGWRRWPGQVTGEKGIDTKEGKVQIVPLGNTRAHITWRWLTTHMCGWLVSCMLW